MAGGSSGFFNEGFDFEFFVHRHDAEGDGLFARDFDAADGGFGARGDVVTQHLHVVHFVDVITSKYEDVFGPVVFFHDVHVLPHGIGGAPVPGLVIELLTRRQHIDELVAFARQEGPAVLQVAQE